MMLLGLPLREAEKMLREAGADYTVVMYRAKRMLEGADDRRVIRANVKNGSYELIVSEFKTNMDMTSQG